MLSGSESGTVVGSHSFKPHLRKIQQELLHGVFHASDKENAGGETVTEPSKKRKYNFQNLLLQQ